MKATITIAGIMLMAIAGSIWFMVKMAGTGMQYQDHDPTRSHIEWVQPQELEQDREAEDLAEFPGYFEVSQSDDT